MNMKKIMTFICPALLLLVCSPNEETVASQAAAPEISSISIQDGSVDVDPALGTISVYTTAPVTPDNEAITLASEDGTRIEFRITPANKNFRLTFGELDRNTLYTLTIPAGSLHNAYDPALVNATAASVRFTTLYTTPESVTVNPDEALTDPDASEAARRLYDYIRNDLFLGGKIATGTMAHYTTQMTEAEWVCEKTGRYPALHCFDLMNLTGKEYLEDYADLLPNARAWHEAGGIVAAMWHWRDPSKSGNDFYVENCSFDLAKIVAAANPDGTYTYATDSEEYLSIMEDIAAAKAELKKLADAGIPVLWRPLHEARGKWFWWGNAGADACKALWQLLRREMGDLHNLIWVWTVQVDDRFGEAQQWYPGDDRVDIVGVDIYEEVHDSFAEEFRFAAEVSASRKVIALTECGAMPDVDKMQNDGAAWAYCMPWYGEHTQSIQYNGIKYWQRMMTGDFADRVIDRSEVAL